MSSRELLRLVFRAYEPHSRRDVEQWFGMQCENSVGSRRVRVKHEQCKMCLAVVVKRGQIASIMFMTPGTTYLKAQKVPK
jgi:hypothetical protein